MKHETPTHFIQVLKLSYKFETILKNPETPCHSQQTGDFVMRYFQSKLLKGNLVKLLERFT